MNITVTYNLVSGPRRIFIWIRERADAVHQVIKLKLRMTIVVLQPLAAPESPAEVLKPLVVLTIAGAPEFAMNYQAASVSCRIMQEQCKSHFSRDPDTSDNWPS